MPSASWANGWLAGDVVTAAEMKKGVGSIYDTTLGIATANIDVTPIVGSYAHLRIWLYARTDFADTGGSVNLRFNNDSGANYDTQSISGAATTASSAESFAQTSANCAFAAGANVAANIFHASVIDIHNYANSSNNKTFTSTGFFKIGVATGNLVVRHWGGAWRSNAAITRVTLLPPTGNFAIGTRATIYAWGA